MHIKFVFSFISFQSLYFRSVLLCFLILQFNGLVKLSLIAFGFAFFTVVCCQVAGGFGAVWVFGHLARVFFVIWSFREFSHFKICFASFCPDFGKFIRSFSSLFEIYYVTSWIFSQEI